MVGSACLVWITPSAEQVVIDCARVSSDKPAGSPPGNLLTYLRRNAHWSPFEMASACLEIRTTRDVSRQLIRHRSFSFQEFSQRYAETPALLVDREARAQDRTNRQASNPIGDDDVRDWWNRAVAEVASHALEKYRHALSLGVARECARALLPEGLTPTRMFMAGTLRSWMHFLDVRLGNGTQPECVEVAEAARQVLARECPMLFDNEEPE